MDANRIARHTAAVHQQLCDQGMGHYTAEELIRMYPQVAREDLAAGRDYVTIGVPSGSEVDITAELARHILGI